MKPTIITISLGLLIIFAAAFNEWQQRSAKQARREDAMLTQLRAINQLQQSEEIRRQVDEQTKEMSRRIEDAARRTAPKF